jgi:transcriptional regulator with XRE-family HTH domain
VRYPIGYRPGVELSGCQSASLLRSARRRAGLSLRAAAAKAGTSHATVAAYEAGRKSPSVATLFRILAAWGFAADIVLSPRIRERGGLSRGKELEEVLALAEAFPARVDGALSFPRFGAR